MGKDKFSSEKKPIECFNKSIELNPNNPDV